MMVRETGPKGSDGRGLLTTKEETMRLVTCFEAASRTTAELHGLYREAFNAAASAKPGSKELEAAQLSLCNIRLELSRRSTPTP